MSPLTSKKFVAFLVADITSKILAGLVLFWGKDAIEHQVWAIMLAIIIVSGFVEAGYIIGQGSLDKFTKIAELAAGAGGKLEMKGITVTSAEAKPTEPPKDPAV